MKTYSVIKKTDWMAKWITPPDELLQTVPVPRGPEGCRWIWPSEYTRVFLRKTFNAAPGMTAKAEFVCDNIFDLYLNGHLVSKDSSVFSGDLTAFLLEGENLLAVRAYQSATREHFTSGFCGCVKLSDGMAIPTDQTWKASIISDFHVDEEPEGWMNLPESGQPTGLICCCLHPRQERRSVYVRKEFSLPVLPKKGVISVCAAGTYDLFVNGRRAGDDFLPQGPCEKYVEFRELDVTPLLHTGKNTICAVLANGWLNSESHSQVYANRNRLLLELDVTLNSGEVLSMGTDDSWRMALSPLVDNDLQLGERYDARLEKPGWMNTGYPADGWFASAVCPPDVELRPFVRQSYPPIRVKKILKPFCVHQIRKQVYFYDFGVNCAGRGRIVLRNTQPGQQISLRCCERLTPEGTPNEGIYRPVHFPSDSLEKAPGVIRNLDVYTCRGAVEEVFEVRFAYTGCRYLYVEGCLSVSQIGDISLLVVHNDVPVTGKISSGYTPINQLSDMILRTWFSNLHNGPEDCPTREKNFWTADTWLFSQTACFYTDAETLLARWTEAGRKMGRYAYGWEDEYYLLPWTLYRFYRDTALLRAVYPQILEQVRNRTLTCKNGLPANPCSPWNDHLSPDKQMLSPEFFAAAFYCLDTKITGKIAEILEDFKTADEMTALHTAAVAAFNDAYGEEDDYAPHNAAGCVLPLAFGLVPPQREKAVAARMNRYITDAGYVPMTGYIATRFLPGLLCDYGYADTAFRMLDNTAYPSWRYMIETGATTITETWQGLESPSPVESMNHFTLGSIGGWFFAYLGGIRPDLSAPAFSRLTLKPFFSPVIGSFSCEYASESGTILSSWRYDGPVVTYSFRTPVNATLLLPDGSIRDFRPGRYTVSYQEQKK